MSRFVLDSSVTMAWGFEDEKSAYSESILDAVSAGSSAVVPALWPYEILNVLVMAQRKKRMTQAHALHFWRELQSFSITIDESKASHTALEMMSLAERHHLTAYDAAYLELALRESLPLATLDDALKKAAKAAGIALAHPSHD